MSPKILNRYYLNAFFIDLNNISGRTKHPYQELIKKKQAIERWIGANVNISRDFTDNHKYNYLRDRINERKNKRMSDLSE